MNVVITGGSNGLGRKLVEIFLVNGHIVTSIDRVPTNFVAHNYTEIQTMLDSNPLSVAPALENCDILINNAASIKKRPFLMNSREEISEELASNLLAPIFLMQLFLEVTTSDSPVIINVSSNAANFPVPNMSLYGACKAMLSRLTLNLQREIKGVRFLSLEISGMRTGMQAKSNIKNANSRMLLDPEEVARRIYGLINTGKSGTVKIGIVAFVTDLLKRSLPKDLFEYLFAKTFSRIR